MFALFVVLLFIAYITSEFIQSWKGDHCDICGGKLVEIGNDYRPDCWLFGGFDSFFKCQKCGKIYKVHHYTYD